MKPTPPPSNLRYPPFGTRELPDRTERYTEPRPLSRRDMADAGLWLVSLVAFLIGFGVLVVLFTEAGS